MDSPSQGMTLKKKMSSSPERQFRFRLALALGKTLGEIDAIPYGEYLEWQEFYNIEPFGVAVHDLAQANIVRTLAEINRDSKKRGQPYALREFLLFKPQDEQSAKAPEGILLDDPNKQTELMIAAMFGGLTVVRA